MEPWGPYTRISRCKGYTRNTVGFLCTSNGAALMGTAGTVSEW